MIDKGALRRTKTTRIRRQDSGVSVGDIDDAGSVGSAGGASASSAATVLPLPKMAAALRSVVELASFMADAEAGLLARHAEDGRQLEVSGSVARSGGEWLASPMASRCKCHYSPNSWTGSARKTRVRVTHSTMPQMLFAPQLSCQTKRRRCTSIICGAPANFANQIIAPTAETKW